MSSHNLKNILGKFNHTDVINELTRINRGVERECLRLDEQGNLAQTPHPKSLGSALCHPFITTDFSESLLEFVTPVFNDVDQCLAFLTHLHQFTYQHINDEKIWMNSMPCILPGITHIPIAQYGQSNSGQMKHIYRVGLSNRYGSAMQTISGIHYNFSVSPQLLTALFGEGLSQDDVSNLYMGLVRNLHRHCWMLMYLFGTSPAVCKSFLRETNEHGLENFDSVSFYGPNATTLRMSDLGYRNVAQSRIKIGLSDVENYTSTLREATEQSYPDYEEIGVKTSDNYNQLNTNLLQIENEYYTVVRPKQVIESGEKPTTALKKRGIGYVELRCLDINPNSPIGLSVKQIRFVDTFLLYCLFCNSPSMSEIEKNEIPENRNRIVRDGRNNALTVLQDGEETCAKTAMLNLINELRPIAKLLDKANQHELHMNAIESQIVKVNDPDQTPSALIIKEMQANDESFFEYAMRKTLEHENTLKQPLPEKIQQQMQAYAKQSLADQRLREESECFSFDEYLKNYFNETLG